MTNPHIHKTDELICEKIDVSKLGESERVNEYSLPRAVQEVEE